MAERKSERPVNYTIGKKGYDFVELIDEDTVRKRIGELGVKVGGDYAGQDPFFLSLTPDGTAFLGELMLAAGRQNRHLNAEHDTISLRSYPTTDVMRSHVIRELSRFNREQIAGRHVLIINGIVNRGATLAWLLKSIKAQAQPPASLSVASLVVKPDALAHKDLPLRYVGFQVSGNATDPYSMVVGFGIGHQKQGHELPYIAAPGDGGVPRAHYYV
jgi:hypoxanthine phosphoribosyltransferase